MYSRKNGIPVKCYVLGKSNKMSRFIEALSAFLDIKAFSRSPHGKLTDPLRPVSGIFKLNSL